MTTFFGILTKVGEAKEANAKALGIPVLITEMEVGDGGGVSPTPDRAQTALIGSKRRAPINRSFVDPNNPAWLVVEQVIPEQAGGWWVRELGLRDADGDLIAVANCPPTYKPQLAEGSARTQVVRMVLQVSSSKDFELKVDPTVVLATRQYVDDAAKPLATRTYVDHAISAIPNATHQARGLIKLATEAMAQEMSDADAALTSATLAAAFQGLNQGIIGSHGFQRLPGGFMLQTGFVSGYDNYTITFPRAFKEGVIGYPIACCVGLLSSQVASCCFVETSPATKTQFQAYVYRPGSTGGVMTAARAVGYLAFGR